MLVIGGGLVGAVFADQHRGDVLLLDVAESLVPDRRQIGRIGRGQIIGVARHFIRVSVGGVDQLIGDVERHRVGGNAREVRGVGGALDDDERTRIDRLHGIAGLRGGELPVGGRVGTAPGCRAVRLVGQVEADDGGVARKGLRQIIPGLGKLGCAVVVVIPQAARVRAAAGGGVVIVQNHFQAQLTGLGHDRLEHAERIQPLQIRVERVVDVRRHGVGDHRLQAERDADGVEAEADHLLHGRLVVQHVQALRCEAAGFHAIPIDRVDLHRRAVGIDNLAAISGQIAARQQRARTGGGEGVRRADIDRNVRQPNRWCHNRGAGRGGDGRGDAGDRRGQGLVVEHEAGRTRLCIAAGQKTHLRRIAGGHIAIVPDIADRVGGADMAVDHRTPDVGDVGIERETQRPTAIHGARSVRVDRQATLIPAPPVSDICIGNRQCAVGSREVRDRVGHAV